LWISARAFDIVNAHWSLILLVATGDKSNWQWGSNPLLVKNGDEPVISEASLLAANSANGNHSN
jgi:hypothetical protein